MPEKKRAFTYFQVVTCALTEGVSAIESLDPRPSRRVLRRAADCLMEAHQRPDLASEIEETHLSRRAAKTPPQPGDVRPYRIQENAAGGLYLRIPSCTLEAGKAAEVQVTFGENWFTARLAVPK